MGFFRADTLKDAILYIRGMFVPFGRDLVNFNYIMDRQLWFCLIMGIVFAIPYEKFISKLQSTGVGRSLLDALVILLFAVSICYMVGSGYSPFLYFRF